LEGVMKKRFKGWLSICAFAALLPAMAFAQDGGAQPDVGTTTPPELRDFRLDQPPARPGPEQNPNPPQPEPTVVQPPPVAPTIQTRPRSAPEPAAAREPISAQSQGGARQSADEAGDVSPTSEDNASSAAPAVDAAPVEPSANALPVPTDLARPAPSAPNGLDWSLLPWIAALLAILLAIGAGLLFWRRRTRTALAATAYDEPSKQPSPPARLDKQKPEEPVEPAERPAPNAGLSVLFVPTGAQLSIASLTVTGRLTVENRSKADATQLSLRSQMISAQDGQREAVAAFHANKSDGEIQPLGDMAAGERIDAIVEIRLPRTELHAFRWTEREFVAPIVLINVSGFMGEEPVEARLSQLIGRSSAPASPKMKPLAIDRGPKRYSGVDAHPVFA
jgi:hypothetical protein